MEGKSEEGKSETNQELVDAATAMNLGTDWGATPLWELALATDPPSTVAIAAADEAAARTAMKAYLDSLDPVAPVDPGPTVQEQVADALQTAKKLPVTTLAEASTKIDAFADLVTAVLLGS